MIFPILSRRSGRPVATERIAMISELTVMAKPELIMKPSIFPPRPITISRRCLGAEVDHPFHLDVPRIDIEAFEVL